MNKYEQLSDLDRAQLQQLANAHTWDGNLISKRSRDRLDRYGFVCRACGFNFLTMAGIIAAVEMGFLKV